MLCIVHSSILLYKRRSFQFVVAWEPLLNKAALPLLGCDTLRGLRAELKTLPTYTSVTL